MTILPPSNYEIKRNQKAKEKKEAAYSKVISRMKAPQVVNLEGQQEEE